MVSVCALVITGSGEVRSEEAATVRFTDGLLHTRLAVAPSDHVERRPSGEVHVATALDGLAIQVVFASEEDYRALVGKTGLVVDLEHVTAFMRDRDGGGHIVTGSLLDALHTASVTFCGNVAVRAIYELKPGLVIGLNFAGLGSTDGGSESQQSALQGTQPPPRVLGENKYKNDVFGECDTLAIGGCGGPDCTNMMLYWNGEVLILPGTCISWGPFYALCSCNTNHG